MKLKIKKGTTSKRLAIFIQDSSSGVGAGLAALLFNSAGLSWYYWRESEGDAGGTVVALATATRGTFASGGFKEKDATNLPGFYEIGIPDAALATGANWVVMQLKGAANMVQLTLEIQLVDYDPQDGAALGLTDIAVIKADLPTRITKNVALAAFPFFLVDSTDHVTGKTGAAVTPTRSIDGAAFAACANAVVEIANGWYKIDLAATDLNGNTIALKFTAAGADPRMVTIVTQPT
jgi:hypothetical protein